MFTDKCLGFGCVEGDHGSILFAIGAAFRLVKKYLKSIDSESKPNYRCQDRKQ